LAFKYLSYNPLTCYNQLANEAITNVLGKDKDTKETSSIYDSYLGSATGIFK
jgi:hypothetical protein